MTVNCPDCGEEFKNEKGVNIHISQSDCERVVGASADKEEAKAVPSVEDDEHVAVGFKPMNLTRQEIEDLIYEINDARRSGEEHEKDEHYDELHDELRDRKQDD